MKTKINDLKDYREFLEECDNFQKEFKEFKEDEKQFLKKEKRKQIRKFARANGFVQFYKNK